MNNKILTIAVVAAIATMLIATSAVATEDAFADKKKHKYKKSESQAVAQANSCGNGDTPIDVFCQNLASQIQGDGNAVIVLGAQPS
jgi:Na+-translocating ferredoxin:NAD+ oxidoreductase RnfG subunit